MKPALTALVCILALAGCATRPAFVPKPSRAFERFSALRELRTTVPVGALWIEGYGPHGDGAAADNLVTETSLKGVTFDNDIRATLTLGFLQFLDLDPSYRSKVTARFNDLTIVRVKDISKLAGPAGESRIYAGLKAGSITITTVDDVGLDIEGRIAARNMDVIGRGSTGQARTFTIDAKDMFLAVQVADVDQVVRSKQTRVKAGQLSRVRLQDVSVTLRGPTQSDGARCVVQTGETGIHILDETNQATIIALPVPVWRDGVLFTNVKLERRKTFLDAAGRCKGVDVNISLVGTQMQSIPTNGHWRER